MSLLYVSFVSVASETTQNQTVSIGLFCISLLYVSSLCLFYMSLLYVSFVSVASETTHNQTVSIGLFCISLLYVSSLCLFYMSLLSQRPLRQLRIRLSL